MNKNMHVTKCYSIIVTLCYNIVKGKFPIFFEKDAGHEGA